MATTGDPSGRGRHHHQTYRIRCEWCWEVFRATQLEARTCGNAHRLRLSRWRRAYRDLTGILPTTGPRGDARRMTPVTAAIADGAPVAGEEF